MGNGLWWLEELQVRIRLERVMAQQGRLEECPAPVEGASLEVPVCWGRLGDYPAPVEEAGLEVFVK